MADPDVTLRPAVAADRAFLLDVYASARQVELDQVGWAPGQREAFLEQQFSAQDLTYRGRYPQGAFLVVELAEHAIGRLYVGRLPGEIRVIDIALLAGYRGRGIGTRLIRKLMDEAAAEGSSVTLYVEASNPAHALYLRLGFERVGEHGVYELLAWRPPSQEMHTGTLASHGPTS
jgi:ribosomal protein S18 acetylase RimI-like enzyme